MSRKRRGKSAQSRRAHEKDALVRAARAEGYRSRAAFKLLEIDEKETLFFEGACAVDLGAAPGGWSQVAAQRCGPAGAVVACDILDMKPINGVVFERGDFMSPEAANRIRDLLGGVPADIVISDMAPNLSGVRDADQARAAALARAALAFAAGSLQPRGRLLAKAFQGGEFAALRESFREQFSDVKILRLRATRTNSSEVYLLAQGLKTPREMLQ